MLIFIYFSSLRHTGILAYPDKASTYLVQAHTNHNCVTTVRHLTHSLTYSLTHLLTDSLTNSLTHSLTDLLYRQALGALVALPVCHAETD